MQIIFSDAFRKDHKKIKDKQTRHRILSQVKKLQKDPLAGKPLKYSLKNCRSLRIPPFRIIYKIENEHIVILCFDHRRDVYK